MAKTKIKTGEGLEVMKDELKILWLRDLQDNENRQTFKNIGVGGGSDNCRVTKWTNYC